MRGCATPEATRAQAEKHPSLARAELGSTGLVVSQAGFGCLHVDLRVEEHRLALRQALAGGINLVDTASNYAEGNSELLVGRVLAELEDEGRLSRDQVVVVTKGGYLQGPELVESQERKNQGRPWPELVECSHTLEHCLHPEFLAGQLAASLERLGLERVDAYLLHNPETYLDWAARRGVELAEAREEYYRRLGAAFEYLEGEVAAGRISFYGVSSNTFSIPDDQPDFTSLARLWDLAERLSPGHHFRVIELPFNLLETSALTLANQPGGRSVLAYASERGLGVLTNRPLNAMAADGVFRLAASGVEGAAPPAGEVMERLSDLQKSEKVLRTNLLPNLHLAEAEEIQLGELLEAAGLLLRSWQDLSGLEHWRQMEQFLTSRLNAAFAFLARRLADSTEGLAALDDHLARVKAAFETVHRLYAVQADREAAALLERSSSLDPDWSDAESLSRLAIRAVRSTQGVSSVLVGMRRRQYVEDVLAELARKVAQRPRQETWQSLAALGD